ncbi:MAG: NADPH:quinone reductase [Hyphomicrobiaceae bacterium]
MRAAWYERNGPAEEVIQVGTKPDPAPGAGDVLIRLMASGVNPADGYRRRGVEYGMEGPFVIPNSDGAGVVEAVGAGVTRLAVGQRVWLYNGQRNGRTWGTAAELIALDETLATPLPDAVSFEAGACLGIPCMTAHRCVFGSGPVTGLDVLVTGGGGAVGNYAIQLAKWGGARVLTTVGTGWQREDAITAGADVIVDRSAGDLAREILDATRGKGVDRIVDVDFGGNLAVSRAVIALNGTIAAYATRGDMTPTVPFREFMRKNVTVQAVLLPTSPLAGRRQAQADILRWLQEGTRLHRIAGAYPLAETVAAHQAVETGGKRGTIVVLPQA